MSANNVQIGINKGLQQMPDVLMDELLRICKIPATSNNEKLITNYLLNKLADYNPIIDAIGNIIIRKGNNINYPVVCSHLDTVHHYEDKELFYYIQNEHKYLFSKNSQGVKNGIGGDDKCGILVCLYLLEKFDNIKIVFFTQEESGAVGSQEIEMKEFQDASCIIGVDRWGNSDFINIYCGEKTTSKEFDDAVLDINHKYNYKSTSGLMTDSLVVFEREVDIPCINVSCGYYRHHSSEEIIDTNELYNCCLYLEELLEAIKDKKFEHKIINKQSYRISPNNKNSRYFPDNYAEYYPGYDKYKLDGEIDEPDDLVEEMIEYYSYEVGLDKLEDYEDSFLRRELINCIFEHEGINISHDEILNYCYGNKL